VQKVPTFYMIVDKMLKVQHICFKYVLNRSIFTNKITLKNTFFYNCQKNVTFMHRYQVAKYVIFDSEKIFVKKFPWMLK
jgi:hypothetical protein